MRKPKKLIEFREKVSSLKNEWKSNFSGKNSKTKIRSKKFNKLKKGLRTPEDEYRIPILESIVELGGKGEMREILERVREKMKDKLNEYDFQSIPSNPNEPRWRNTAQWCRLTLVKEGLLSSSSPKGIWEITEKGRKYLEEYKKKS